MFKKPLIRFKNNPVFFSFSVFGLMVGVVCFACALQYHRYHSSFDEWQADSDRIYRVTTDIQTADQSLRSSAMTFPALAPAMKAELPEVESVARITASEGNLKVQDKVFLEERAVFFVDSSFFSVFSYHGKQKIGKFNIGDAVITRTEALRLFGTVSATDQTFEYKEMPFRVSAVINDPPANSHFRFSVLLNYGSFVQKAKQRGDDAEGSWKWTDFYTYVKLKPHTKTTVVSDKLYAFIRSHRKASPEESLISADLKLQPLTEIHIKSELRHEFTGNGNYSLMRNLLFIGIMILIMAWLNYINLAVADGLKRIKEFAVRKVMGASPLTVKRQVIGEIAITNLLASAIGIGVCIIFARKIAGVIPGFPTSISDIHLPDLILLIACLVIISVAGALYPAFLLASLSPQALFKNVSRTGAGGTKAVNNVRRGLVIVQYVSALLLIICSAVMYQQIMLMQTVDNGIETSKVLALRANARLDKLQSAQVDNFKYVLEQNSNVRSVSVATSYPGRDCSSTTSFISGNPDKTIITKIIGADDKFLPVYSIGLTAGRNIKMQAAKELVVNETNLEQWGYRKPTDIIDKQMVFGGDTFRVVGVTKDWYMRSFRDPIEPLVICNQTDFSNLTFSVKLNKNADEELLKQIAAQWNKSFPESAFTYLKIDEVYDGLYVLDNNLLRMVLAFAIIAVILANLALFAQTMLYVQAKMKEITIRKVFGAGTMKIVGMISSRMLVNVIIGAMVAVPLSVILIRSWLEQFNIRIPLNWQLFAFPILLIMITAAATISILCWRAAKRTALKSLQSE